MHVFVNSADLSLDEPTWSYRTTIISVVNPHYVSQAICVQTSAEQMLLHATSSCYRKEHNKGIE
jgi:hypothetical protein